MVATQGRRAHWITIDSSLRFEVSFYESKMYFFYFWSWWSAQWRTQQRFAKLELKKASSTWKTEIWNIQKNADATMVMIMRWARAIRELGLELGVKLELNSPILCWQGRTSEFVFLLWRSRELEISRWTNSGVGDFSFELGSLRFFVGDFLLRARRNKQLLAQALSVIIFWISKLVKIQQLFWNVLKNRNYFRAENEKD